MPKKEKPQRGGWGARGAGALIFETKTHPVTAGIMIEERIGSPPYELNWIACIPLLLMNRRQDGAVHSHPPKFTLGKIVGMY